MRLIVVDGLIGAGKSTLIKLLATRLNQNGYRAKAILEPVELWKSTGALQHFYNNIQEHAYEFQTFVYVTRIKEMLLAIQNNPETDIFILERSTFTDKYVFFEMLKKDMTPTRIKMYHEWCDLWDKLYPKSPDLFMYLDTSVETSHSRLTNRNRSEETNISQDYLKDLESSHHHFYKEIIPNQMRSKSFIIPRNLSEDDYTNIESKAFVDIYKLITNVL